MMDQVQAAVVITDLSDGYTLKQQLVVNVDGSTSDSQEESDEEGYRLYEGEDKLSAQNSLQLSFLARFLCVDTSPLLKGIYALSIAAIVGGVITVGVGAATDDGSHVTVAIGSSVAIAGALSLTFSCLYKINSTLTIKGPDSIELNESMRGCDYA
ncbi:MAG: hypothetical protein Q7V63_09050 [Gammaproteobacteria bacterium]|nr:hypothetical protein [Gammaproteobacteria bacterium]